MAGDIVILGGGVGGLVAANRLRKTLGKERRVVLVDRKARYEFAPSFPWLMMGLRRPAQITRDLARLGRKGVDFLNVEVSKIDPANRVVRTSNGDLGYDYLVLALGAELAPETLPGFQGVAHHIYELEAATKFREALMGFRGGRILMGISSLPYKCPAAPYEAALLSDYLLRKRGLREKVEVQFFTPEPYPLPVAGAKVGGMVRELLEARGIAYTPKLKLAQIDGERREAHFENGEKRGFDLFFAIPPHRCPSPIKETDLTDSSGWVAVDPRKLRTKYDDLYALGDVTGIKLPSGMMLPKAGVFAHGQAEVVAHNIAADILGGGGEKEWDGFGSCFLETGFGRSGYASGNFYANPNPQVNFRRPRRIWHWGKILFEKYWLWRWF